MAILEDIADDLAKRTLDIMDQTDDAEYFNEIAKVLGATSQTLEEAFLTSMRIRLAERRARATLAERASRLANAAKSSAG